MSQVCYQPTILVGLNKKGVIKCDPDGYYDMLVGAFDAFNSAGAYYTMASAKENFDASSDFQRRISSGALYGEKGHPVHNNTYTRESWMRRVLTLDQSNLSHHIREVHLDNTTFKNKDGSPMVAVYARIKPIVDQLAASLENPNENTAFSIRSITQDHVCPRTGILIKEMRFIVTYDWVIEPGIHIATKYHNPSLESHSASHWTNEDVDNAIREARDIYGGFEDNSLISSLEMIRPKDEIVQPVPERKTKIILPNWAKWY